MLKLIRKKSFNKSSSSNNNSQSNIDSRKAQNSSSEVVDYSSGNRRNSSAGSGFRNHRRRPTNPTDSNQPQQNNSQYRSSSSVASWDRRSIGSAGYRYSSISAQLGHNKNQNQQPETLPECGREESPPEILQYARPPENLTSPNRESNGYLQDSLVPSPGLQRKIAEENARLQKSYPQAPPRRNIQHNNSARKISQESTSRDQQQHFTKKSGGVLSALRNSFRRSKKKLPRSHSSGSTNQNNSSSSSFRRSSLSSTNTYRVNAQQPQPSEKQQVSRKVSQESNRSGVSGFGRPGSTNSVRSGISNRALLLPGRSTGIPQNQEYGGGDYPTTEEDHYRLEREALAELEGFLDEEENQEHKPVFKDSKPVLVVPPFNENNYSSIDPAQQVIKMTIYSFSNPGRESFPSMAKLESSS